MLLAMHVGRFFADGPAWGFLTQLQKKTCDKFWWTNLLYINNFYPKKLGDEVVTLYLSISVLIFLRNNVWKERLFFNNCIH